MAALAVGVGEGLELFRTAESVPLLYAAVYHVLFFCQEENSSEKNFCRTKQGH
jgi:hypothetical protein